MTEEQNATLSRQLEDSLNLAEGIRCPATVEGRADTQAGLDILVSRCPCGCEFALSGEGKHLCRHCQKWLKVVRPA